MHSLMNQNQLLLQILLKHILVLQNGNEPFDFWKRVGTLNL